VATRSREIEAPVPPRHRHEPRKTRIDLLVHTSQRIGERNFSDRPDKSEVMERTDADAIRDSLVHGEQFLPVVERHFTEISRYLRRRVAREIADELVSNVFTTAFARRATYDLTRESALPWLYGIASNALRNRRRHELRELEMLARVAVDPLAHSLEPLDRVLRKGVEPALARGLLGLTPEERDVLLLFAWGDLSYEEIAEALGLAVGTVKSRLSRARTHIRASLEARTEFQEASHG
jgi:RNA polymerase sigma factor (sigma-70 family)